MVNVGWVGNYRRAGKNFGQAYRVCQANNWNLLVAGGTDSGLFVQHEEMPGFYEECDVLLVTSVWEAHPLIVYEALACGVPVVMSKYVGDCFRNNLTGLVYYDNIESDANITEAIHMALNHSDELSKAGVECIKNEWMWKHVKPQYNQLFRELTGKEKPRVSFLINESEWSWGWMANEIKKYVYPALKIHVLNEKNIENETWSKTDLVLNHPWHTVHNLGLLENIPQEKHVLCVNGPAFLNPIYTEAWRASLESCSAITSVSMNVIDLLRFTGKPLFYATRGLDTGLFKPSFVRESREYLKEQDMETLKRLSELGVTVS